MQIVIPMSGFGERFRRAGYQLPKPLIQVDGRPIISYVIDLFPGETNFLFICNQEHLDNPSYRMREILQSLCPTGKITGIAPHKFGPIYAVMQVIDQLNNNESVIVNYCDFSCYWDWKHFKKFVISSQCDGAIPAYKGFHPHSLGATNYAYLKESEGWVSAIQEKKPFTLNRMDEYASSGTYYFSSVELMHHAFRNVIANDLNVGGEFYVSLSYNPLLAQGKHIAVYPIQHFMQWGTPEDLGEYQHWSDVFKRLISPLNIKEVSGATIIPMAGLGKRFADEGYAYTKPLIPVSGQSMANQAINDLPNTQEHCFILRSDMPGVESVCEELLRKYPNALIPMVDNITQGQACTAEIGLKALCDAKRINAHSPILFGACDNGVLFNAEKYLAMLNDPMIEVIVWGVRGHPNAVRHPHMFGWIDVDDMGLIQEISVKQPLANPRSDPIVIGTFSFKRAGDAQRAITHLIERNGLINGEFYLDSCINDAIAMGLRCVVFEIDAYISWGTPNELRTFEYWQSCFSKWALHPYELKLDAHIPSHKVAELTSHYQAILPAIPLQ